MKHLKQYVNWRLENREPGKKPAKVPVDLTTGQRIDPLNPAVWLSYDEATRRDPQHVGVVLTEPDPYFCIDLDAAYDRENHAWSPTALGVLSMFPGAYTEVSHSNDGLHVIGQGTPPPGFSTRGPGVEFYSHSRFIAITGTHAQGDPDTWHDLTLFAALYLKPAEAATPTEWTDQPCAGSNPIADNDELIRKALSARASAGVAFGGKASFADLWNNYVTALADAWPSQTDEYDRSSADAALAAHLAFWTGKDCARIERLMRRSALVREKWDRRGDDYLKRTIVGACGRVQKVYDVGPALPSRPGLQYMTVEQQQEHFAGCCYVIGQHRVFMPNGDLLKPEAFKASMGGFEFQMTYDSSRPSKNAFEAFTESRAVKFPKSDAICFRPELAPGVIVEKEGRRLVNAYTPVDIKLGNGDPSPFLDLMRRMLPDESDRAIVLAYLAALRQFPGRKFRWAPLFQGTEGNGKSAIGKVAEYCVGERYAHRVNAKELGDSGSKFTGWLDRKLLIVIEEVHVSDRRNLIDALKPLITDDRVEIQRKGVDQFTAENRANFILTSNHKDALAKTANDRRYAVFYTAQQSSEDKARDGLNDAFFVALYRWLEGPGYADVAGYLTRLQIPDALNPATNCVTAPRTSSTDAAIAESLGHVEQEIIEACAEGRPGFAGGWVSSVALVRLLSELRRTIGPRKRGELLKSLGYLPHPALPNGRASTVIFQEDMKRPYLYVREGSIEALNVKDPNAATANYMKAQGYVTVAVRA